MRIKLNQKQIKISEKQELFISALLLVPVVLMLIFPSTFMMDLLRSMLVQGIMLYLLILFVSAFYIKGIVCSVTGGCVFLMLMVIMNDIDSFKPHNIKGTAFKISHFNVLKTNHNSESIINAVLDSNSDLISFQEITEFWKIQLINELSNKYPYYHVIPRENSHGLAIFSKYPLEDVTVHYWCNKPSISGYFVLNDTKVSFVTAHPIPPTSYALYKNRNRHINLISMYLKDIDGPAFVIGDFNAVPWDSAIHNFKSKSSLSDSRISLATTYPAWSKLVQIPIDYIFYTEEIECRSFQTISGISSDHLGIEGIYEVAFYY